MAIQLESCALVGRTIRENDGLFKGVLHKSIRNGMLSWPELQDILLEIEVAPNKRPLSYVDKDIQLRILTASSSLYGQLNMLPELEPLCQELLC